MTAMDALADFSQQNSWHYHTIEIGVYLAVYWRQYEDTTHKESKAYI